MPSAGIMASAIHIAAGGVDVLSEPFKDFTTNTWTLAGVPTLVPGRTGAAASLASSSAELTWTIPSGDRSEYVTVGFAWKFSPSLAANSNMCELRSDSAATRHGNLFATSTGALTYGRDTTALATSAAGAVTAGTWYYVELQVRLHDSAGSVIVKVNGVEKINSTGLDTKNAGTSTTFDQLRLANSGTNTVLYDDLYVTTGAAATFKGDITIGGPIPDELLEPFNNTSAWTVTGSVPIVTGRTGNAASVAGVTPVLVYTIPSGHVSDVNTVGFAWRTDSLAATHEVCWLALSGAYESRLVVTSTGRLQFFRTGAVNLGQTVSGTVVANTWYYIEIQVVSSDSVTAGNFAVRLNGSQVIGTTTDTHGAGPPNELHLLSTAAPANLYDDLYLICGGGAAFKGDITIP